MNYHSNHHKEKQQSGSCKKLSLDRRSQPKLKLA
jgi:hypothetical protein